MTTFTFCVHVCMLLSWLLTLLHSRHLKQRNIIQRRTHTKRKNDSTWAEFLIHTSRPFTYTEIAQISHSTCLISLNKIKHHWWISLRFEIMQDVGAGVSTTLRCDMAGAHRSRWLGHRNRASFKVNFFHQLVINQMTHHIMIISIAS